MKQSSGLHTLNLNSSSGPTLSNPVPFVARNTHQVITYTATPEQTDAVYLRKFGAFESMMCYRSKF